jgi:hypothetical protein
MTAIRGHDWDYQSNGSSIQTRPAHTIVSAPQNRLVVFALFHCRSIRGTQKESRRTRSIYSCQNWTGPLRNTRCKTIQSSTAGVSQKCTGSQCEEYTQFDVGVGKCPSDKHGTRRTINGSSRPRSRTTNLGILQ